MATIKCGNCGHVHESVADVRQCYTEGVGNKTDVEQEVDAIIHEPTIPTDPWEGATEQEPGDWTPGPDWYLDQRRKIEANGEWHPSQQGFHPSELVNPEEEQKKSWDKMLEGIEPGYYALSEDEIYQVVRSKAGRLYAKLNVGTQSGGQWEYAAGAITKLKPEMRMDLAAVSKYGKETGTCLVCGRTLTNPDSIEAGIGPICASRF